MTHSRWLPSLCADTAYMNMRLKRIAVAGIPPAEAERLKRTCCRGRVEVVLTHEPHAALV